MTLSQFYFSFRGRVSLKQFWFLWVLPMFAFMILASIILVKLNVSAENIGMIKVITSLILLWPGIAIAVKRWHDRGKSGWWMLIVLIPIVGGIWSFIELYILPGKDDGNPYTEVILEDQ